MKEEQELNMHKLLPTILMNTDHDTVFLKEDSIHESMLQELHKI